MAGDSHDWQCAMKRRLFRICIAIMGFTAILCAITPFVRLQAHTSIPGTKIVIGLHADGGRGEVVVLLGATRSFWWGLERTTARTTAHCCSCRNGPLSSIESHREHTA